MRPSAIQRDHLGASELKMPKLGHRWLGRWKRQRCQLCGALRSSTGPAMVARFSTDGGRTWTAVPPGCMPVKEMRH